MRRKLQLRVVFIGALAIAMSQACACRSGPPTAVPTLAGPGRTATATSIPQPSPTQTQEIPTPEGGQPGVRESPTPGTGLRGLIYETIDGLEVVEEGKRRVVVTWTSLQVQRVREWPGLSPQPCLSPDGRKLAYTRSGQDLWIADLATGQSTQLISGAIRTEHGDVMDAAWSPDGAWLALLLGRLYTGRPVVQHQTLFTVEIASGRVSEIVSCLNLFAWVAPSGELAYMGCAPYGLFLTRPDGEERRLLYHGEPWLDPFLTVSPSDGTLLVVEAGAGLADKKKLLAVSPVDGSVVDLLRDYQGKRLNPAFPCWSPDGTQVAFFSGTDLYVLDVSTRAVRMVQRCFAAPLAWSLDSSALVAQECRQHYNHCLILVKDGDVKDCQEPPGVLLGWR